MIALKQKKINNNNNNTPIYTAPKALASEALAAGQSRVLTLLEVSRHICRPRVKGIPTYRSPKVKGCTDIYVILTYMGTETDVSFGLFIPEIHFFGQGLKFHSPLKGLIKSLTEEVRLKPRFKYRQWVSADYCLRQRVPNSWHSTTKDYITDFGERLAIIIIIM